MNEPLPSEQTQPGPQKHYRSLLKPLVVARLGVTGLLMGLAFLVPGVSGGTMVLVMGFYDDFVSSIADVTRLRFTKRNVVFLTILVGVAAITFVSFAGPVQRLVTTQRSAMYSLFIGLTLGGAPLLHRMMRPLDARSMLMVMVSLIMMISIAIAATTAEKPDNTDIATRAEGDGFQIEPNYGLDVVAGVLGVSAMVLPGISGAYMLLLLGRYETILASIAVAKQYVLSGGSEGDFAGLGVILAVGIGVVIGVVGLSNLLKWLLHNHEKPTLGFLMGVLLGSVIGIWPFEGESPAMAYAGGAVLGLMGFGTTFMLSRLSQNSGA